jgi:hypothetical protein
MIDDVLINDVIREVDVLIFKMDVYYALDYLEKE